jgi:hypothetical protein
MTTTSYIRVTDESTRAEVAEAMVYVNDRAKHTPHAVGTAEHPTLWDRRHSLLNAMLTDWEARPEPVASAGES